MPVSSRTTAGAFAPYWPAEYRRGRTGRCSSSGIAATSRRSSARSPSTGRGYKLVQANGVPPGAKWQPKYELFDLSSDPFEEKDLAADKPDEVAALKDLYEHWFADVTKKGFAPPRIVIGSEKENPVRLSRQDWRGPKAGWTPQSEGHWEIEVDRERGLRVHGALPIGVHRRRVRGEGNTSRGGKTEREAKFGPVEPAKEQVLSRRLLQGNEAGGVEPG